MSFSNGRLTRRLYEKICTFFNVGEIDTDQQHATVKIPPEGSSSSLKSSFIKRVTAQRQVPRLLSIVNQQFNILISHWQFLRLCIEILAFCFVFYLGDSLTQLWSKISSKSGPRKSIEFCQKYQKCNIIVLIYIEVISFS